MKRSSLWLVAILSCICGVACSNSNREKRVAAPVDPLAGFFAQPSVGMLELQRAGGEGKYQGSLSSDFGPFPVELTRDGNIAQGTVTYDGAAHSLRIDITPQGLLVTIDGKRAAEPMRRYENKEAYGKWFEAEGGYHVTITATTRPNN